MRFEYPPDLPVSAVRDDIARMVSTNQVVIVAGATGSGKTTQLPKIALELGRTAIAHTQPRRIAARSVAERVASELGVELGREVGYQVRFDRRAGVRTKLKLMTDGVLLAELAADPKLSRYDTVIIDEAHERSLTIDVLLGHLKLLLAQRPDLRVIITSATIDPESFAHHFADASGEPAPVILVEGRTYPVEIRYRPLVGESDVADEDGEVESSDRDYLTGILDALDELDREEPGDVLVFLSGEAEIRDASDAIRGHYANRPAGYGSTDVLPLYGRLAASDQQRIFDPNRPPGTRRRVILSTNVAETSLTVPGIRYVIDTGMARMSRYSARSRVQRLPIEPISQASAAQRAGRAGRTAPGIAIRLTSEDEFLRRPEYTDPEVLRTSLASVLLQLAELGVDDPASFPFLTPPDSRELRAARDVLVELGALSATAPHTLTPLGRTIARIPLEPRYARMLVDASERGVARDVMVIVAALCIHDPRERPSEHREAATAAHARFKDPSSDFLSLLGLWNYLSELQQSVSGNQFRKRCRAEFLHYLRVREWQDLVRQLERTMKELGLAVGEPVANPVAIHRSIIPGLLSSIGTRVEPSSRPMKGTKVKPSTEYLGARGRRFALSPGSDVRGTPPALVMAAELVETSRLFARTVAGIEPAWVIAAAGDLVERSYSEPRWDRARGSAIVTERVSLYGVVLSAGERRQLARLQPELARELFVRHALVLGEWEIDRLDRRVSAFARKNRDILGRWNAASNRLRERHPFDETGLVEWYLDRIPAHVTDVRSFEKFWRDAVAETPELLTLPEPEPERSERLDPALFPREWQAGPVRYRLSYTHAPGREEDGVSVLISERDLARAREIDLGWVVPGLRTELVAALLRSLPKTLRREVVPANAWAERLIRDLPDEPIGDFREELAALIKRVTFAPIRAGDFDLERVPAHLKPRYVVIGPNRRPVRASRSLEELRDTTQSPAVPEQRETDTPTPVSRESRIEATVAASGATGPAAARAKAWAAAALAADPELSDAELDRTVRSAIAEAIPAELAHIADIEALARAVDKAIRRASSIDRVGELARERARLEELTGAGFLERLSPDTFAQVPAELRAALARIDPSAKMGML
ncbi:MAG TPA: ATP-dependent RNA helicase HrpA [Microbacteriaceae bacterium]|nr:ATP-dependent RNA helicase HrpA [Microbacteriaceae bacterium]